MLFDDALRYLLGLGHETLAIKLGLANTERLLDALGRPQQAYQKVQLAGTNGKGSTAVMLDAICRASGIETALFTSPHLTSITERMRFNGAEISEDHFAALVTEVRATALRLQHAGHLQALPTFFEHLTVMFLLACRDARTELAILETGLGGRLDATTAARAETVGITPLAMDHQEYLGTTLAEVAAEKAAIIRAGVSAVVAVQPPEAMEVIIKRGHEVGVEPFVDDCSVEITRADPTGLLRANFKTPEDFYENVAPGLRGRHQMVNAGVAIRLAETLRERGFDILRSAIVEGLNNARHPGRLELWQGFPSILFDGAHNAAGARALLDYLDEFIDAPVTLVFGAMRDKELREMGASLFPRAERLILTGMKNPRAASRENLLDAVPRRFDPRRISFAESTEEAVELALDSTKANGLVCVSGSLYLVGEARELLSKRYTAELPTRVRKS